MIIDSRESLITEVENRDLYSVNFIENIFDNYYLLKDIFEGNNLIIILSETVNALYGEKIVNCFKQINARYEIMILPTGEKNKNMDSIRKIISFAKVSGIDRKSILVGIGGGILLDMVGFAASMIRRRIRYVRIPTTLIGQIDAGVGIKTGINFENKKNYIGSFYPPIACINDSNLLRTLPKNELKAGLAEIIKMAIIKEEYLFKLLESNLKELIKNNFQSDYASEINFLAVKAMISELESNFLEKNLKRLVDFGHTFSPVIEERTNYSISHGYAVAIDIAISTEIAYLIGMLQYTDRNSILDLLLNCDLPLCPPSKINEDILYESLYDIELHRGGNINLVIPVKIGKADFINKIDKVPKELISSALINLNNYRIQKNKEVAECQNIAI